MLEINYFNKESHEMEILFGQWNGLRGTPVI